MKYLSSVRAVVGRRASSALIQTSQRAERTGRARHSSTGARRAIETWRTERCRRCGRTLRTGKARVARASQHAHACADAGRTARARLGLRHGCCGAVRTRRAQGRRAAAGRTVIASATRAVGGRRGRRWTKITASTHARLERETRLVAIVTGRAGRGLAHALRGAEMTVRANRRRRRGHRAERANWAHILRGHIGTVDTVITVCTGASWVYQADTAAKHTWRAWHLKSCSCRAIVTSGAECGGKTKEIKY